MSRAARVVFVDAALGTRPGAVDRKPVAVTGGGPALSWSHELTPSTLAALAKSLYSKAPPMEVVTVAGLSFEVGEHLSEPVAASVGPAAAAVVAAFGPVADPDVTFGP